MLNERATLDHDWPIKVRKSYWSESQPETLMLYKLKVIYGVKPLLSIVSLAKIRLRFLKMNHL